MPFVSTSRRVQERRDVADRHRLRAAVLDAHARLDQAGGDVEPHDGLGLGHLDHPGLDEHGRDADRPVPAHRQAAADLDEDDAPVGVVAASAAGGSRRTSRRARAARA